MTRKPRRRANAASPPTRRQQQQQEEEENEDDQEQVCEGLDDDEEEEEEDVFFDDDEDYEEDGYASASPPPPPARYLPHPSPHPSDGEENPFPDRPVRVYADGIYDLFHFGHARSLEQAKKSFPNTYLLVGCCSDAITHKYKGKTVMTDTERYESLRHCKWVDEVIPDAPWVITQDFLDKHRIDFVAHDALPYADASGAGKDVYEFVKTAGKFKETKRTDGISTSDIIMRIVKDYNEYVMRNLARGYSRKELGVSYVKEKQLRVNMGITKLRQKVKEQQERVGQKLNTVAKTAGMHHSEWVENADRWVSGFLEKFEEKCHLMESAIKLRIQKGFNSRQQQKRRPAKFLSGAGVGK